ncbi:MAG: hypothetical protein ACREOI_00910 [bacterium]
MKKRYDENCLGRGDFNSYLTGAADGNKKARIEQHLSHCGFCFEIFIGTFNRHLDHPLEQRVSLGHFTS